MKKLILISETSDSDNSHLKKLNLKNNTLSIESFKRMLSGMELTESGPKLSQKNNINLIRYSNGEETYGKVFEKTKAEIEEAHISIRDIKDFCNQLQNYFAYQYKNKKVFCTHGGISSLKDISLVSELSFVIGSDSFDSDIDKLWEKSVKNVYQIHGHRNENNYPILASTNSFNLEGAVEVGGSLRVLELNSHFHVKNFKNKVYSNEYENVESAVNL